MAQPWADLIVLAATGLFAGAALYVSAVEHPARMSLPVAEALREFRPSYRRGAVMQIVLAVIGGLGGLALGIMHDNSWTTVGGAVVLSAIPYTLIFIMKTNHTLMDDSAEIDSASAQRLLQLWGKLHAVRTALGLVAFIVMLRGASFS